MPTQLDCHTAPELENKSEKQPKYVMQAIIIAYRPPKTSPDNKLPKNEEAKKLKKKTKQKPPWSSRVDD